MSISYSSPQAKLDQQSASDTSSSSQIQSSSDTTDSVGAFVTVPPPLPATSSTTSSSETSTHVSHGEEPRNDFCHIEVKTQGGETINLEYVDWDTPIRELKKLLLPQLRNFDIDEIRLFCRGKALSNDSETISKLGFKNKESVFIVRKLRGESSESLPTSINQVPVSPPSELGNYMTIQVPAGCLPGSRVQVTPPGGAPMIVIVPHGVPPGGTFNVPLNHMQQQQQQMFSSLASTFQSVNNSLSSAMEMDVTCPPGVHPGSLIDVLLPSKARVRVAVPQGVAPGQVFRIRLPY